MIAPHLRHELREQALIVLRQDFPEYPHGTNSNLVSIVEHLAELGDLSPLTTARQAANAFTNVPSAEVLDFLIRLALLGWSTEDLTGLREDWVDVTDATAMFRLLSMTYYYTVREELPAGRIRAGLTELYTDFSSSGGPVMTEQGKAGYWPWRDSN